MTRTRTPRVICMPHGPVANWRRRPSKKAMIGLGGAVLALAGCTTFGTNIKGSFSCGTAGEGTCAPATVIDDRALAEIAGDASYIPAGPYRPLPPDMAPGRVVASAAQAPTRTALTGQKVLRIVFPAHVDRAGRYHETSVVKAVVDNGSWMQASADHGVALAQTVNLTVNPDVLSQLESAPLANVSTREQLSLADPDAPSPEAVAAARARGSATRSTQVATAGAAPETANRPASFNPQVED